MPDPQPTGITVTPAGMVRGFFGQLIGADPLDIAQGIGRFAEHPIDTTLEAARRTLAEPGAAYQALREGRYGDALDAGGRVLRTVGGSAGADVANAVSLARAQAAEAGKAYQLYRQGRNLEAGGHTAAALLPALGPAAAGVGERMADTGDLGRGIGESAALLLGGRAAGLIAGGVVPTGSTAAEAPPAISGGSRLGTGSVTSLGPSLEALERVPPAGYTLGNPELPAEFQMATDTPPARPSLPTARDVSVPAALESDRYTPEDIATARVSLDRLMQGKFGRRAQPE